MDWITFDCTGLPNKVVSERICLIVLYERTKFSNQFAVFIALKLKFKPNQSLSYHAHVDICASFFFIAVKPLNKIFKLKESGSNLLNSFRERKK